MKKQDEGRKKRRKWILMAAVLVMTGLLSGCGGKDTTAKSGTGDESGAEESASTKREDGGRTGSAAGLTEESAADGHIDFEALQAENPDVFAWLYVPGTDIDDPILQSPVSDDYYKTHTADGSAGNGGALYTEMPNMMDMCDFNTIIHGMDTEQGSLFSDLHLFEDPDFFAEHQSFYIYLPDNVLTYEIFAAFQDEGSDILRRHDYTTYDGCEKHLQQIYGLRDMNKNLREGWEDLTPYHFLVTLNGSRREEQDGQYVVIGVLTGDAAGKIDRVILD